MTLQLTGGLLCSLPLCPIIPHGCFNPCCLGFFNQTSTYRITIPLYSKTSSVDVGFKSVRFILFGSIYLMNMNSLIIVPSADIRQESFSVLSSYLTILLSKYPLRYLISHNDCLFCVSILRKHMATNAARIKLPLT